MTKLTDEELEYLDKFCHLGATSPKAVRQLVDEVKEARRWIFSRQEERKAYLPGNPTGDQYRIKP